MDVEEPEPLTREGCGKVTAGTVPWRDGAALAGRWCWPLCLLALALSTMFSPGLARAAEDTAYGPFLVRSEAIVTRLGGEARTVDRWFVYTLGDGDRLWIKIEPRDEGTDSRGACYFAAANAGRWRFGRCLSAEGKVQDADPFSPVEVAGTGFDLRDLAAVVDHDRVPAERPAAGQAEVSPFGEAGGKGPHGIRIRRADGTERIVTFLSEGRRRKRTFVRKFQVALPGAEGSTVFEFRDAREVSVRPGDLGRLEEFCDYRLREDAPAPVNAE